jgi:hypothetical protein
MEDSRQSSSCASMASSPISPAPTATRNTPPAASPIPGNAAKAPRARPQTPRITADNSADRDPPNVAPNNAVRVGSLFGILRPPSPSSPPSTSSRSSLPRPASPR